MKNKKFLTLSAALLFLCGCNVTPKDNSNSSSSPSLESSSPSESLDNNSSVL